MEAPTAPSGGEKFSVCGRGGKFSENKFGNSKFLSQFLIEIFYFQISFIEICLICRVT